MFFISDEMKNSFLMLLLFLCLCISTQQPITKLYIDNNVYTFSIDIHKSLQVPVKDEQNIRDVLLNSKYIEIVFNGTSNDNAYFAVVGFNIAYKLAKYRNSLNNPVNISAVEISNATFKNTSIVLLGPRSGAKRFGIHMSNLTIYVEGRNYEELIMSGDKLILIVMGVDASKLP